MQYRLLRLALWKVPLPAAQIDYLDISGEAYSETNTLFTFGGWQAEKIRVCRLIISKYSFHPRNWAGSQFVLDMDLQIRRGIKRSEY